MTGSTGRPSGPASAGPPARRARRAPLPSAAALAGLLAARGDAPAEPGP